MAPHGTAQSLSVTDETTDLVARGKAIRNWRKRRGMSSQKVLADLMNISDDTVGRVENGSAPEGTVEAFEDFIEEYDAQMGTEEEQSADIVRFRLSGNFGIDLVVEGPVNDLEQLEASVSRLIRQMGEQGRGD